MATSLGNFDQARDQIKEYLPQYLASFGYDTRKRFRCINPGHQDKHPSSGIVPNAPLFHCFSCGLTGDIFDAAGFLENKPLSGRGFITDNLLYLAKRFGVDIPELNLDDKELHEIEMRRAYAHAARIIQHANRSEVVQQRLAAYTWPEDIIQKFGIGTVESYDSYIEKMTKSHGHKLEFLMSIDLAGKDKEGKKHRPHPIFQSHCLIYTVKDEHGAPIAFSARNLNFEAEEAARRTKADEINASNLSEEEKKQKIGDLWRSRKYVNTEKTILFEKRKVLFNFDQAKRSSTKTLIVFEGNADCVTVFAGGIKGSVALCGTAFTAEHVELALAHGINRIVICLDPDAGGEKGTQRAIDTLEQFGNHPGLTIELVSMPEGTDDPDAYVRAFGDLRRGVAEFRKLPRTDLFSWKLKKAIEEGADPILTCDEAVPLIVNQPNDLFRLQMADRLAEATGVPKEIVRREVMRRVDEGESRVDEERTLIAQETARAIAKDPRALESIMAAAAARLEVIEAKKLGYDPLVPLQHAQNTFEEMEAAIDTLELVTGYPIFDSLMGGIPKKGVMISFPGKPHHAKSIFLDNLIIRMLKHNANAQIFLHHVDDVTLLRLPRLMGVLSGLTSRSISKAGASMLGENAERFDTAYSAAKAQMLQWMEEERLIMADQAILAADLPALERWTKQIRRRHPERNMVVLGDNFHLFDMPGMEAGEAKMREMSKFIAGMPKYGLTTGFTMEIPKETLKPGVRPKYTDSKGSGGISFDSKVNINVYQELQDYDDSEMVWTSPEFTEVVIGPAGEELVVETKMPIIEIIIDKNKVTGEKRTIFFKLEPKSGSMEECSEIEQYSYRQVLTASKQNRKEAAKQSNAPYKRHI